MRRSVSPRGMPGLPVSSGKEVKVAQSYQTEDLLCRYSQRLFLWDFYPLQSSIFVRAPCAWVARHRPCFAGAVLGQPDVFSQLAGRTPVYSQKVMSLCCTVLLIRVYLAGSVPCWHSHIALGHKLVYICPDWEGGVQLSNAVDPS